MMKHGLIFILSELTVPILICFISEICSNQGFLSKRSLLLWVFIDVDMLREIKATLKPDSGTVTQHDCKHSDIATRPTKDPTARESGALVSNTYFYISSSQS